MSSFIIDINHNIMNTIQLMLLINCSVQFRKNNFLNFPFRFVYSKRIFSFCKFIESFCSVSFIRNEIVRFVLLNFVRFVSFIRNEIFRFVLLKFFRFVSFIRNEIFRFVLLKFFRFVSFFGP